MAELLIGIDDTDNPTSIGTGHLARRLSAELQQTGAGELGVTRHQFLIDEAIPYTSHNSGACIGVAVDDVIEAARCAVDFVACNAAQGSDPGICVALKDDVGDNVMEFAACAQTEILKIEEAFAQVDQIGVKLRGLGGNCLGVIGALCSVGLRAQGGDGRFIDLPGLRRLPRRLSLIGYEAIGVSVEHRINGREPAADDTYDTMDWARPRLIKGKPVLIVQWSEQVDAWIPVDRKKQEHCSEHSQVRPA
jgi:hypothetical protein